MTNTPSVENIPQVNSAYEAPKYGVFESQTYGGLPFVLLHTPPLKQPIANTGNTRPLISKLKGEALDQKIREAIKKAIDEQVAKGGEALNGKQQVSHAMNILRDWGIEAPRKRVDEIADAEFRYYRNPVGVTRKNRLKKQLS